MKHRIKSTGNSSSKFGPCEICKEHAAEIFILTRLQPYRHEHNGTTYAGQMHHGNIFGCRDCLNQFANTDAKRHPETVTA